MSANTKLVQGQYRITFSQCGEDQIVGFVLRALGVTDVTYVDIGAHHPVKNNNTYLFHMSGGHGICVEPNPELHKEIAIIRDRDICLNVGVAGTTQGLVDYYMMSNSALNTFSRGEATKIEAFGNNKLESILKIPVISIEDLLDEYFENSPDFISIDVEGLDFEIVQAIPFDRYRPLVVCVETVQYTEDNTDCKRFNIIEYFESNNYINYADTYVNTIFVDKEAWMNRSAWQDK